MSSMLKYLPLFCLFLASTTSLFAQPDDLPSEEVEVIKDFEAQLEESERLEIEPALPTADTAARSLDYSVPAKSFSVEYLPAKIRPIAMSRDKVPPGYRGFLKLGYGIPSSPYAELAYRFTDPKKYNFAGHLRHHSAHYKELENQRFSETDMDVDGTYYFDQGFAVEGKVGVLNDQVYFYGYDHEVDDYPSEDIHQIFNTVDVGVRLFNGEPTAGDINYDVSTDFYRLSDNFSSRETGFDFGLDVTKWFNEKHPLQFKLGTDFTKFVDTATQNLNNFNFNPTFTYHADRFNLKLGGNLTSHEDNFRLFPDVEASVNIAGSQLAVFAGVTGGLQKNNFRHLSDYNPFILSRFELRNTQFLNIYGGLRGNVQFVSYQVQAGLKRADDLALFLNSFTDTIRFEVLYDTVDIFNIQGTVNLKPVSGLEILLSLGQNFYSLERELEAWHLPALDFNASLFYTTLEEKLKLKAELFVENGVPIIDLQGKQDRLNGLFDLSLGAHYQISKNFGAFLDLNNLLSNNRQRWYRYPTYGINVMGGITARF